VEGVLSNDHSYSDKQLQLNRTPEAFRNERCKPAQKEHGKAACNDPGNAACNNSAR